MSVRLVVATTAASAFLLATAQVSSSGAATLDYDYFKTKVQPIFVAKRPGHAPCVVCHAGANNQLKLQLLPEGQKTWDEEDTHKNFDTVSKIVNAVDNPLESKILIHPLAPEAGGDAFHSGGRQFANKNDPAWKAIAAWAQGATLTSSKGKK